MNYQESLSWLYETQRRGIRLGLRNMTRLADKLSLRLGGTKAPTFLHVAGTNGKGSVCAMLEAICRANGARTGMFTSPHLVSFRERIRVNGQMIAELDVALGLTALRKLTENWEEQPTFFEITTALALAYFQRVGCEIVVLETGLGGRLDATNIVIPAVSVITSIGVDHQDWLGSTLLEIAYEKAGIIKPFIPVVTGPQEPEIQCLLSHVAVHRDAPFNLVVSPLEGVPISLVGSHQQWNAALAIHALEAGGVPVAQEAIVEGLRSVQWPGRFHVINDRFVLDGAHNPSAARQLAAIWHEQYDSSRATIIFGIMKDKNLDEIAAELSPIAARFIVTSAHNLRARAAPEIQSELMAHFPDVPCAIAGDLPEAILMAEASPERILVTGSLFLVGEASVALGMVNSTVEASEQ